MPPGPRGPWGCVGCQPGWRSSGVELLCFVELVFEGDDSACGVQTGALVDEFPHARGDAQLVAGVVAVAAGGALRFDQFRPVQAAQATRRVPSISAARPIVLAG